MFKKIALISDHAGVQLKNELARYLNLKQYEVNDMGPIDGKKPVSYAKQGLRLGKLIASKSDTLGIGMCGTGIGIAIAANRIKHIRAARVTSIADAKIAKKHNNANVLTFGGRITTIKKAVDMFNAFVREDYEGGRHNLRIKQLDR